jgi:GNAT superfamily N-acetyltransferase
MQNASRNIFVDSPWILRKVDNTAICDPFDCGDDDLNEYFHKDAILYKQELLTQTYCLQHSKYLFVAVALLDFCNDAVHVEQYRNALKIHPDAVKIDPSKQHKYFPAVKVTRFGVHKEFQGRSIGTHTLNMVKKFFITDNRTGCRFLTVDAYNKPEVLKFYARNGFKPFTEKDKLKPTRALYFDLKPLVI